MLDSINIEDIKQIALKAGAKIMNIYTKDFSVEYKDDKSPLTEADLQANEIICTELEKLYPQIPIISEENKQTEYETRKEWKYYWCIDPIDGTKEFIKKNDEFTVNIALIYKETPVLGVVCVPALNEIYYAKQNHGAFKEVYTKEYAAISKDKLPLKVNSDLAKSISVVASKSHLSPETQEFIDELSQKTENCTLVSKGSSLKLCMVATGEADIYPRLAPTMEWDTAAADAIVREAGKMTYQYHSKFNINNLTLEDSLCYNKENLLNPWFVVK